MWESTRLARAKAGQERSGNLEIIIITAVVFLPLFLFGVIFVSITWTHRPELSVLDIMREAVKEIKIMRAGKERQKGKTE
jgi:hypothetical protein